MMRLLMSIAAAAFATAVDAAPAATTKPATKTETAVFAGGCFWCVESDFDKLPGVVSTTSGYTGGHLKNPTYRDVTSETSGHREAVEVAYDPARVSYARLVEYFFRHIDPTDAGGQFCDRGESYTTAIFVANAAERATAEAAKASAEAALKKIVFTRILDRATFYAAEDYHQDYYKKNPTRYEYYRAACGRDRRVKQLWSGR